MLPSPQKYGQASEMYQGFNIFLIYHFISTLHKFYFINLINTLSIRLAMYSWQKKVGPFFLSGFIRLVANMIVYNPFGNSWT